MKKINNYLTTSQLPTWGERETYTDLNEADVRSMLDHSKFVWLVLTGTVNHIHVPIVERGGELVTVQAGPGDDIVMPLALKQDSVISVF